MHSPSEQFASLFPSAPPTRHFGLLSKIVGYWAIILIALSIVWPRYGFLDIAGTRNTPFTLISVFSWLFLAFLVSVSPTIGQRFMLAAVRFKLYLSIIGFWFAWRYLSSLVGEAPGESIVRISRSLVYFGPVLAFAVYLSVMPRGATILARAVVFCTFFVLSVALAESFTGKSFAQISGLRFVGEPEFLSGVLQPRYRGSVHRIQSIFYHPIVFGQYLAWAAPVLLAVILTVKGTLIKAIALASLFALPWAATATDSRAAILAVALSLTAFVGLRVLKKLRLSTKMNWFVICFALAMAWGLFSFGSDAIQVFISGRNSLEVQSTNVRNWMFEIGVSQFWASPVVGYGDGRSVFHSGGFGAEGGTGLSIDSQYLTALLDGGALGLVFCVLAYGGVFILAIGKALSREGTPLDAAAASGTLGVFIVFSILSITDNETLFFVTLGLLGVYKYAKGNLPVSNGALKSNSLTCH